MRPAGPCAAGRRSRPRTGDGAKPAFDDASPTPALPKPRGAAGGRCGLSIELPKSAPKLESLLGGDANRDKSERPTGIDRGAADALARSIATLLDELLAAQSALRQREAQLAANVPLASRCEPPGNLAARLDAVLRRGRSGRLPVGGALPARRRHHGTEDAGLLGPAFRSVGGAGKAAPRRRGRSRSAVGSCRGPQRSLPLPACGRGAGGERSVDPAGRLSNGRVRAGFHSHDATGHALGFGDKRRDFSDRETNMLEVVAGRLASDLERETLVRTSADTAKLPAASRPRPAAQRSRLPTIAPLLDGWQLSGRSRQAEPLGGAFHDWFSLPKGRLAVAVGRAADQGIVGAINADAVMAALRSHAQHRCQTERILRDANLTLWSGSAGDRHVTGLLAMIDPATGRLRCSSAGRPSAVWLRPDGWKSLTCEAAKLGESPEAKFPQLACQLRPGEALLLWTDGSHDALATVAHGRFEARLAERLQPQLNLSADRLLAAAAAILDGDGTAQQPSDRALVVVKRTPA